MSRESFSHTAQHTPARVSGGRRTATRWLCLVVAAAIAVAGAFATAFAKGGDYVSPFPVADAAAGKQEAKAMAVDSAGNIIVAGYTNSGGMNNDYRVAKFKADGTGLAWPAVTYDRASGDDTATAVAVDGSGDIIVAGYAWNGSNYDIHTIKYGGTDGSVLWQHTFAGAAGGGDFATAIVVDASNNIYVAGYSANGSGNDDFLIIKYPSAGSTPTWTEIHDDATYHNHDRITAIAAGSDGIAVTGYSSKGGADFDILTRKYGFDKSFVREWRKSSAGSLDDRGVAVRLDGAGDVIVAGSLSNVANTDIWSAKYNAASGATTWEKTHDGGYNDEPRALWVDGSGNAYVTGYTFTLSGHEDFYTVRYNAADGAKGWDAAYHSAKEYDDIPVGIVASNMADGGVFVTGYTVTDVNDNITTLKYAKDSGVLLWQRSFNGAGNKNDRPVGLGLASLGSASDVFVAGWSDGATSYDYQAIRYDYGPLNAPTGLEATATSNTAVSLQWGDNSVNEDGFKVERKLGAAGTFAQIGTVGPGVTTYSDSGLVANSYYYYRVRAYNAANGDSDYSNESHVLTKVVSYDAPAWSYLYNSADNREDVATGITIGSDDHPIVTGYSDLTEEGVAGSYSYDYLTFKLDRADTSIKWKARYDSGDGGTDMAAGVGLDNDGDAIVTGTAYLMGASDKSDDLYTIKYQTAGYADPNTNPAMVWDHQYGTQSGIDLAKAIRTARDGSDNSVVIGYGLNASNNYDIFLIKYNADGTRPWTPVVYDSGRDDLPTAVAFDASGNIFVTGYTTNTSDDSDWITAKYNGATGAQIWSQSYAGAGTLDDQALGLAVDAAGNVYVTGYAVNAAGDEEWVTIKYDGADASSQREIWKKIHNGPATPANGDDRGISVAIDPIDGAVVVAGTSYVSATDSDFRLIRYNAADGAVIWERNFDRPTSYDYLTAMAVDSSGYLYVTGTTRSGVDTDPAFDGSSDIMSLIYNHEGTFLGAATYDGTGREDKASVIATNYQGEAFMAGFSRNAANPDYVVLKQKNNYILVPAPLAPLPQADSGKMNVTWRNNSPGTSFRVERTLGPALPTSTWTPVTTAAPGTTGYLDTGLTAGTTYCYRVYAYSGSLTSRTIESCATTTLGAPTLNALTVDSTTQITLTWSQVAGNTGYKIERKIGAGAWADLTTKAADVTTHSDTGLAAGTTYTYRVSANSAAGYSLPSGEQTAPTKPAAPTLNVPSGITATDVTLTWTNVAGETGYKIEYKIGAGGTWGELATKGVDVTTHTHSGLTANTTYYYRVKAYNAGGDSAYSGEQAALTRFVSTTLSSAIGAAVDKIDLVWADLTGETGYTVQYVACNQNGATNGATYCTNTAYYSTTWTTLATLGADVTTYQAASLTAGYAYRFRIIANTTGNTSDPSNDIIAWTRLAAPVVTVTPASETSLTPSWPDIAGETNYTLERKQGAGGTWAEVTGAIGMAVNTTSKTDTGLSLSTEYCYRVKAYSTNANGPPPVYSNEPCLFTPLAAPTLNAPTATATQVDLSWNNVAGNTGYEVQMRTMSTSYAHYPASYWNQEYAWGAWTAAATLATNTTTHSQTGLTAGYTYQFRVRDTYSGGTSAWSGTQWITTIPPAPTLNLPTAASTTQLNLAWNNNYGETGFKLEWKARSGADCTAGAWNGPISIAQNVVSYNHTGLTAGTYYCYQMYAVDGAGNSPYSSVQSQTTLAVAPTLNAPSGVTASQAVLTWNNVTGNSGYRIERKTGAGGTWGTVTTTAADAVTYTNTGLAAGTLYYYRVSTMNGGGASAASNEQSTTTTPIAPTVTATTISAERIDLSWPVVPGATNYKVERKEGAGAYGEIANVSAAYVEKYCGYDYPTVGCPSLSAVTTSYQSGTLTENTIYCYQIKAWNSTGGDSPASVEKCSTTSAMANQNVTATAINAFKVRVDWTTLACAPNPCDTPQGFEIQKLVRDGIWVTIATVDGADTSYTDNHALDPGRKYSYRVRAYSGADRSPFSEASAITLPYVAGETNCK
ncbi:fibronectin type III domain-containing protein [Geobacter sp.]|uniref:fibronectin type III domain-containing protein n=1 Tax=Geobacter sp. TaxID=46610 RepID=UPI0027BB0E22|nr:fibronectin type III domain-containing protein [Geobacter sp.]